MDGQTFFARRLSSLTFSRRQKFGLLALIPIYFIIAGFFLQPIDEIIPGLIVLLQEPDFLITDYFLVGGIGASFINAGVLTLCSIGMIYALGKEMDGHAVTSRLPDVRFFSVWKEPFKYLVDPSWRLPIFQIP